MSEYIPVEKLELGSAYKVDARNFSVAIWDGKCFMGMRYKFSHHFMGEEFHWDDENYAGTCKPIRLLE